ncbi:hypothetical protein QBC40DRAFT_286612 [Triangularia verruculosa]|uniref:Uncharacterized protein n=1 Tax=Triangularia verruculosa TaxID=2587418 RepID=A0AAN7APX5_9PEZI|nr:hypothetical protein QBC40DRAFT_286612 [Triangularia verruculosa]
MCGFCYPIEGRHISFFFSFFFFCWSGFVVVVQRLYLCYYPLISPLFVFVHCILFFSFIIPLAHTHNIKDG